MGYQRETLVDIPGSFCIRGGILDIYTVSGTKPVRIELFGDRVESIRLFDLNSQISFKSIKSIVIPPAEEILPSLIDKNRKIMINELMADPKGMPLKAANKYRELNKK